MWLARDGGVGELWTKPRSPQRSALWT